MNKQVFSSVIFNLFSSLIIIAQCPTNNITISSQAQVNSFAATYPGCTEITVDIFINGNDITDLSGMSQITSMNGELIIAGNQNLTTLAGLGTINFFGPNSALSISDNPNLVSLTTFTGTINKIGGHTLALFRNPNVTTLSPLSGMTSATGLLVEDMDALTNLNGLQNLSLSRFLSISKNDNLSSLLALSGNLGTFNWLSLGGNTNLQTLSGMEGVQMGDDGIAPSRFTLGSHPILTDISALSSITYVANEYFAIGLCPLLTNLNAFSNISGPTDELIVTEMDGLEDLSGLEGINTVSEYISIWNNDNLLSLSGLEGITNNQNAYLWMWLDGNPLLNDITALNNMDPNKVAICQIQNNTSLDACATQLICEVQNIGNAGFILANNASGCNTEQEIEQGCLLSSPDLSLEKIAVVFNPQTDLLSIQLPESTQLKYVELYSSMGNKTGAFSNLQVNLSHLSTGIYFIRIYTANGETVRRIVKD